MKEGDKKENKGSATFVIKIIFACFLAWVFYRYVEVGGLWGAIVGGFFIYLLINPGAIN
jgi:hypothetical protein